jgi:hypothetical protein
MRPIPTAVYNRLKARQQIGDYRPSHAVYVINQAAAADTVRTPFWEETTPPEEWTSSSYRPHKTIQGYNDQTNVRISNWVPTSDGRHMCSWVDDDNRVIIGYTAVEENYLINHYPCDSIEESGLTVVQRASGPSLWRRDDGAVLLFLHDLTGEFAPAKLDCYISVTGNGDDFVLLSNVYTNSENDGGQVWASEVQVAVPLRTQTGRLILAYSAFRRAWGLSINTTYISVSDDNGATWSRTWSRGRWNWTMSVGQPIQLPDGSIFFEYQEHSAHNQVYRSLTNGDAWTAVGSFSNYYGPFYLGGYDGRSASLAGSFYYDPEMDRAYRVVPGNLTGCGLYFLDEPTQANFTPWNDGDWVYMMYLASNRYAYRPKIWSTPKGRVAVSWNDLHNRTVILGFGGPEAEGVPLRAKRIHISRSRTSASALEIVFDNKDGVLTPERGTAETNPYYKLLWMNNEIIIQQGYGEDLQQTFFGLIDRSAPRAEPGMAEIEVLGP